jgi:TonB family protein
MLNLSFYHSLYQKEFSVLFYRPFLNRITPTLLVGLLFWSALPCNAGQAQQLPWEKTLQQAEVKWLLGDNAAAASLYESLVSGMGDLPLESQLTILKDVRPFYERQKDYSKVQSLLEKSLAIQTAVPGHTHVQIANLAVELGNNHVRLKAYDKALDCLVLIIKIVKEEEGAGSKSLLPYYDRMAAIYQFQQKPELAMEVLKIKKQLEERRASCEGLPDDYYEKFTKQMQDAIRSKWQSVRSNKSNRVVVEYVVKASGHIERIRILQSSQINAVDDAAISAVRLASPLPSPPKICNDFVKIQFTFDYEVKNKK